MYILHIHNYIHEVILQVILLLELVCVIFVWNHWVAFLFLWCMEEQIISTEITIQSRQEKFDIVITEEN